MILPTIFPSIMLHTSLLLRSTLKADHIHRTVKQRGNWKDDKYSFIPAYKLSGHLIIICFTCGSIISVTLDWGQLISSISNWKQEWQLIPIIASDYISYSCFRLQEEKMKILGEVNRWNQLMNWLTDARKVILDYLKAKSSQRSSAMKDYFAWNSPRQKASLTWSELKTRFHGNTWTSNHCIKLPSKSVITCREFYLRRSESKTVPICANKSTLYKTNTTAYNV